jgi:hypothetical protein
LQFPAVAAVDLATARLPTGTPARVAPLPEALVLRGVAFALVAVTLLSLAIWGCGTKVEEGIARGHELYDTCKP